MLADSHRKAEEDIESTILPLQAQPRAARVVIEGAWGAAFHMRLACPPTTSQGVTSATWSADISGQRGDGRREAARDFFSSDLFYPALLRLVLNGVSFRVKHHNPLLPCA